LSAAEIRQFYDRFGEAQDKQGFYEDAAQAEMLEYARLQQASSLFEFGCGTGRLADSRRFAAAVSIGRSTTSIA